MNYLAIGSIGFLIAGFTGAAWAIIICVALWIILEMMWEMEKAKWKK